MASMKDLTFSSERMCAGGLAGVFILTQSYTNLLVGVVKGAAVGSSLVEADASPTEASGVDGGEPSDLTCSEGLAVAALVQNGRLMRSRCSRPR